MEEDIRRKGTLYLHQQRFGRRWRKVWCVLLAEGRRSVARLELYEHKQASIKGSSKRKPDYKQVIRLRECIRITDSEMADRPKDCGAFLLETTDKLYVFAAHLSEVKGWIRSLCEQAFPDVEAEQRSQREACMCSEPTAREMQENSLYDTAENVRDFLVIAVGTEAAVRCNLYGDYILTPLVDCLLLKDVKTKKVLYKWPYCYVRKFGQDMLSFSFEAGRRCESGEGNFEFATHQGERLFNVISAAIQNLPRPSAAKPASLDHQQQSVDHETVDETYDDTTVSQVSNFLPDVSKPSKMLNPAWRSFSMNAMEPQMESQESNVDLENQEPVYATVSKPPLKPTSPTDPKTHWQNLRKAVHQSPSFFTSDIPQFDFPIPCEDEVDEETEDAEVSADLFDSIQQLSISETLENIDEEAIYADPQDVEPKAEWAVSDVYDELEEVRKADGTDHQIEQDFNFSSDMNATWTTTAPENTPNPETFSVYDNFRLRRL